jgi:hypothetical protein
VDVRFVTPEAARIDALRHEALLLAIAEDERPLRGAAGLCDWRLCGRLSRLLRARRVTGAAGEVTLLPARPRLPFDKLVLLGTGPRGALGAEALGALGTVLRRLLSGLRLRTLVASLPGRTRDELAPAEALGWLLGALDDDALDELVVLDDPIAQKLMQPVVDAQRRRLRGAPSEEAP